MASHDPRGFSLIELLVSISIIGLISALVVVRFSSFDSSVLLKSAAYEVALALRDAQVYSVSARGETTNFDYPYGLHFVTGNSYTFFRYTGTNVIPQYTNDANLYPVIKTATIGQSVTVSALCAVVSNVENCNLSQLDVSFRRPEFAALFNTPGVSGVSSVRIKVNSTRTNSDVWIIEVGLLGQISVYKQ